MPWQRDPGSGEWTMVDAPIADTRQLDQGPHEGYDTGAAGGRYPVLAPDDAPTRSSEGAYDQHDLRDIPNAAAGGGAYQNEDMDLIDRWVQGVQARGNEVRRTAVGTFEVAAGTNSIVSEMPSPYKVN